jgi:hypothetical protein
VRDPVAELAKFKATFEPEPVVGDVWWFPERHVGSLKQPPNDAFCLLAVAERARDGEVARFHFIAGSTSPSTSLTIQVDPSEGGLNKVTYFRFWRAGVLDPATIKLDGTWRDRLPQDRLAEVEEAVRASKLTYLKVILDG